MAYTSRGNYPESVVMGALRVVARSITSLQQIVNEFHPIFFKRLCFFFGIEEGFKFITGVFGAMQRNNKEAITKG